jgi:hypothetical protein
MTSRLVVGLAVVLSGCSASKACGLIGDFVGSYEGDLQGDLTASVTENTDLDGEAVADFVLSGADDGDDVYANGAVDCSTGSLVVDLTDVDGGSLGEVTGTLGEGAGSGDWSLATGETGTWSYGG